MQALPKGDRGELAVQAMTEVGVDVIVPWAAARSVAWTSADAIEGRNAFQEKLWQEKFGRRALRHESAR